MKIKDFLKEMIPVIVGILIALFINNCNESRNDRKYVEKMMSSISEELKENKEELATKIIEHEQLIDTIGHYEDEDVSIGEYIGKVRGIRGVNIKNTAWKAIINTRLELLEYKEITLLASIDEQKGNMKTKLDKLTDLIYDRVGSSSIEDIELFKMTINDIMYTETELLALHEEFIRLRSE